MKDIVIIGAGGLGKEIVWLINNINKNANVWNFLGFIEDESKADLFGKEIYGHKVLGGELWLSKYEKEIYVIIAIGKSSVRKAIYEKIVQFSNVKIATLVDPTVRIDNSVTIGEGSIICYNCSITVDTNIGKGVLLNIGSLIGHDSKVGDFCTFSPYSMISGGGNINECCEVGSGAFILQNKTVVANTQIAPLSAVLKDITEPGTYIGNPARRMV